MYKASEYFIAALQKSNRTTKMEGSIILNDGTTIAIGPHNIASDTTDLDISCVSEEEITLGSVSANQLSIAIYTDIDRYKLYDAILTLDFSIQVEYEDGTTAFETVPLGIFVISEANREGRKVNITAYDNMLLLDTNCTQLRSGITPYGMLEMIADAVNLELAQTQEEIDAMCARDSEGNVIKIGIKNDENIRTYRDLLHYLAEFLGGFAVIDRLGKIKINHFHMVEDIIIRDSIRKDSSFSDYQVSITGITIPVTGNITKEQKDEEIDRNVSILKQSILNTDEAYTISIEEINEEEAVKKAEIEARGLSKEEEEAALRLLTIQYNNIRKMLKTSYDQTVQTYQSEIDNLLKQKDSDDLYVNLMVGDATGRVLELSENPLLFYGTLETKRKLVENMANKILGLVYTPSETVIFANPLLEPGDMVKYTGYNTPASGIWSVITSQNFLYRRGHTITAVGKNQKLSNSTIKSKSDKQYASAESSAQAASVKVVTFKNSKSISINENKTPIAKLELSLLTDAVPQATGQAILNVTKEGIFRIIYELNGILHTFQPLQICREGYNTLNIFDVLSEATASGTNRFNVFMVSEPYQVKKEIITEEVDEKGNVIEVIKEIITTEYGTAEIDKENVYIALLGSQINTNPEWNGELSLEDEVYLVYGKLKTFDYDDECVVEILDIVKNSFEEEYELPHTGKLPLLETEESISIEFY